MCGFLALCLLLVWLPSSAVLAMSLIGRAKQRLLAEHPEFSKYPNLGFLLFAQSNIPFMPWDGVQESNVEIFRKYYYRLQIELWLASLGLGALFILAFLIVGALTPA